LLRCPCQLKLTSPEGIHRGANKKKVYNASRLTADEPTRLFIDALTTQEWRQKGFETVLNEGDLNKVKNLEDICYVSHDATKTTVSTGPYRHAE